MRVLSAMVAGFLMGGTGLSRSDFVEVHMGGEVRITMFTRTRGEAEAAARAAFGRIAELEQVASDYRPGSEISQLVGRAGEGPVRVSGDLLRMLAWGQKVSAGTGGAFDVTVGPVVGLWRASRREGRSPRWGELRSAMELVDWRFVRVDGRRGTVEILRRGVRVDLGGIAKGDAVEEATKVLRRMGVRSSLVQAGGDLRVTGAPPGERGWRISVPGRDLELLLADRAVSTSGGSEQYVDVGGFRYSHIVDPRTGMGVAGAVVKTVVGRTGLETDPLATAACVLGGLGREWGVDVY